MKKCGKCKVEKDVSFFCKNKNKKGGLNNRCKECCSKYAKENRDLIYKINSEYREKNREKYREYSARSNLKNRDDALRYNRSRRSKLDDRYVIDKIVARTSLKNKDVPIGLVEAKRMQLLIYRQLKEMKNAEHQ